MMMYRLFCRREGTGQWHRGGTCNDRTFPPEAREILIARNAKDGLETKFEKVPEAGGDAR